MRVASGVILIGDETDDPVTTIKNVLLLMSLQCHSSLEKTANKTKEAVGEARFKLNMCIIMETVRGHVRVCGSLSVKSFHTAQPRPNKHPLKMFSQVKTNSNQRLQTLTGVTH